MSYLFVQTELIAYNKSLSSGPRGQCRPQSVEGMWGIFASATADLYHHFKNPHPPPHQIDAELMRMQMWNKSVQEHLVDGARARSLKQLQRGPTLKVIISILRVGGTQDNAEKTSETIIVDDKVEVRFKFKFTGGVTPHVSLKLKEANEEQPMVQILLIAREQLNGWEIMNKHLFCTTERVELKMSTVGYYTSEDVNGVAAWSYLLDVDITVYKHFYAATLPNIENVYQDTEFTDFQLSAADGKVAVHKVFLAANSDVFKAMISGEWKEKAEGCINIDGVTVKTLQHLKNYMYRGVLPDEGLESLLVVASQYLMDKLKGDCIQKLVQSLKLENLDVLIKLATRHNIPELVKALVYKTPDSVVTDLHKLEIKGEESTDVDTK